MDTGDRPGGDDADDAGDTDDANENTGDAGSEHVAGADETDEATPGRSTGDVSDRTSEPAPEPKLDSEPGVESEPEPEPGTAAAGTSAGGPLERFRTAERGPLMWVREVVSSAAVVLAIGLVLFAISGVWPPMVAVESGSMEPNMVKGDLVLVTEPARYAPDAASNDLGVVTHEQGAEAGYTKFGKPGSVVVYRPPGRIGSPIIHRVRLHVEEGENWYDRADPDHVRADNCEELANCPAPHAGFITKGDNNAEYDQANGIAPPVRGEWVEGVARVRVPYLGWVRLVVSGQASLLGVSPGPTLFAAGASAAVVARRSRGLG